MRTLLLSALSCLGVACGESAPREAPSDAAQGVQTQPDAQTLVDAPEPVGEAPPSSLEDAATDAAHWAAGDASAASGPDVPDAGAVPLDDAVSHYQLDWLRGADAGYVVRASSDIAAPVERVWMLVRDVNAYADWSPTLHAHADTVAPKQPIALSIQILDPPFSRTDSDEQIEVVDDPRHALAWSRDFGNGQVTLRFQLVEPSALGARYTTGLKFPAELGGYVQTLLGGDMQKSFDRIAQELKTAAE